MAIENPAPRRRLAWTVYFGNKVLRQSSQNLVYAWLFLLAGTSSSAAIGLSSVFIALLLPAILLGPHAGAIVDRIGPGRGYLLGAGIHLATVGLALFIARDGSWAWPLAFAWATGSQFVSPADFSLVRKFRPRGSGGTHSLSVALQYIGQGAGMLVFAPLLYLSGGNNALLLGAAAGLTVHFALGAVLVALLGPQSRAPQQRGTPTFEFGEVARFLFSDARANVALAALGSKSLVSRAVFVALPFYLEHDMGLGGTTVAYVVAPGVAGVLAGLAFSARGISADSARRVLQLSMVAMALAVFALAALDYGLTAAAQYSGVPPVAHLEASLNTTFAVALPVAFVLGVALTVSLVAGRVILTETASEAQQGRVFAIQETITEGLLVLPLLLVGLGVQFAGARVTLAGVGAVTLAMLAATQLPALLLPWWQTRTRELALPDASQP